MHKNITPRLGFTIIEIVLGIGMLTMFLVTNTYYFKKILDLSQETTRSIQSGFLLEEGIEAVKILRDTSWATNIKPLTPGIKYYLLWTGSTWSTTTQPQVIETVFTRSFTLSSVNRDGSDNIVASGGSPDAGTMKVVVDVAWTSKANRATSTKSVETYITNLFNN